MMEATRRTDITNEVLKHPNNSRCLIFTMMSDISKKRQFQDLNLKI